MIKCTPTKKGWLNKLGGRIKTKKTRYFVLYGNELRYYKKEKDFLNDPENPIDSILIESPQRVQRTSNIRKSPAFHIFDPEKSRIFEIIATTNEEADEWVESIQKSCSEVLMAAVKVLPTDFDVVENQFAPSKIKDSYIELVSLSSDIHKTKYIRKTFQKSQISDQSRIEEKIRTYQSLSTRSSFFVANLKHIFETNDTIVFIEEYVPRGFLFGHLWKVGRFSENRARLYAAEILLGLDFLHENGLNYSDLDPRGILLSSDGHIKLTVPGLIVSKQYLAQKFTIYSPPEFLINAPTGSPLTDWYIFGVLLFEMVCGLPPFWDDNEERLQDLIMKENPKFPRHVSDQAKDLIQQLMNKVPNQRIGSGPKGIDEIKYHQFFSSINWESIQEKSFIPEYIPTADQAYLSIDF